jgi:hypothetical protein
MWISVFWFIRRKKDNFLKEHQMDVYIINIVCYFGVRTKSLNINLFNIILQWISGSDHLNAEVFLSMAGQP